VRHVWVVPTVLLYLGSTHHPNFLNYSSRMRGFPKISLSQALFIAIVLVVGVYVYIRSEEGFDVVASSSVASPALPCAMGYWCPISTGKNKGYRCPGGTYGSSTNLADPKCSGLCKAGCVCPEGSTQQCPTPCPAGYYCVEGTGGAVPPLICPEGYYCPKSTVSPIICPKGLICPPGTASI